MCQDARRLLRQKSRRVDDVSLQINFLAGVFTISGLNYFPISISHILTSKGSKTVTANLYTDYNTPTFVSKIALLNSDDKTWFSKPIKIRRPRFNHDFHSQGNQ